MDKSEEAGTGQTDVERHIDDLVRVLKDRNADPCAAARCLRHLAVMLETLGDVRGSLLVHRHLANDQASEPA